MDDPIYHDYDVADDPADMRDSHFGEIEERSDDQWEHRKGVSLESVAW